MSQSSQSSTDDEAAVMEGLKRSALMRDLQEASNQLGYARQASTLAKSKCTRCNGDDYMTLREGGNSACDCWPAQADENAAKEDYSQCWYRHEAHVLNFNAMFLDWQL